MPAIWWTGFSIPILLSLLALRSGKFRYKAGVTGSCMVLILSGLAVADTPVSSAWPLFAAFTFSIVGDAFLSFREGREGFYLYGVLTFFGAHVFYLVYALLRPNHPAAALILLVLLTVPFTVYYGMRLLPHIVGVPLKVAMYAYLLLSCVTFSFTATAEANVLPKIALTAGIGLILFSDSCIGESDFAGNHKTAGWILPTYYLAHLLLTSSVLLEATAG